jgi:hypothetical protein
VLTRVSPMSRDDQRNRELWRLAQHALQRELRKETRHGAAARAAQRARIAIGRRRRVMMCVTVELDRGRLMAVASLAGGINAVSRATVARDDRRQRRGLQQQPRDGNGPKASAKGSHTQRISA